MEQLTKHPNGITCGDRPGLMDGRVALAPDDVHLRADRGSDQPDHGRLGDLGCEVVAKGQPKRVIGFVEPVHGQFQRPAAIEAGRPRIGYGQPFSMHRLVVQFRPLRQQKREVAHWTPIPLKLIYHGERTGVPCNGRTRSCLAGTTP